MTPMPKETPNLGNWYSENKTILQELYGKVACIIYHDGKDIHAFPGQKGQDPCDLYGDNEEKFETSTIVLLINTIGEDLPRYTRS